MDDSKCKFCNVEETTLHMLYYCKYATRIWKGSNQKVAFDVKIQDIITGSGISEQIDFLISLVSYLIYKHWLLESLKDQPRMNNVNVTNLTIDLKYRISLYKDIGWESYGDAIHLLL